MIQKNYNSFIKFIRVNVSIFHIQTLNLKFFKQFFQRKFYLLMEPEIQQSQIHKKLNQDQKLAQDMFCLSNPQNNILGLVLYAPPGSGKTEVVVQTTDKMIRENNVDPKKILILTFGKSNSKDIIRKFQQLPEPRFLNQRPWIKTFNSLAYNVLPKSKRICRSQFQQKEFLEQLIQKEPYSAQQFSQEQRHYIGTKKFTDNLLRQINYLHSQNMTVDQYKTKRQEKNRKLYPFQIYELSLLSKYFVCIENRYENQGGITYNHTLSKAPSIISNLNHLLPEFCNIDYIIIDEFQDSNKSQLDIISALINRKKICLFMVGDPDQNIYEWRYCFQYKVQQFLEQLGKKMKIERLTLSITYRLPQSVKNISQKFINRSDLRQNYGQVRQQRIRKLKNHKELISINEIKTFPSIQEYDSQFTEVRKIAERIIQRSKQYKYSQMTILIRSMSSSTNFIKKLRSEIKYQKQQNNNQIPFTIEGNKSLFSRQQVKFMINCLRYIHHSAYRSNQSKQQLKKIVKGIVKQIYLVGKKDFYYNKMIEQGQILILDENQFKECLARCSRSRRITKKAENYKKFRKQFLEVQQLCYEDLMPSQICREIISKFYADKDIKTNEKFMKLKETEEVIQFWQWTKMFDDFKIDEKQFSIKGLVQVLEDNIGKGQQRDTIQGYIPNKVLIQTYHKSKGLEYKLVFMPQMNGNFQQTFSEQEPILSLNLYNQRHINYEIRTENQRLSQQLRLYYTGFTRTKAQIFISRAIGDTGYEKCEQAFKTMRKQRKREFEYFRLVIEENGGRLQKIRKQAIDWDHSKFFFDKLRLQKQQRERKKKKRQQKVEKQRQQQIKRQWQQKIKTWTFIKKEDQEMVKKEQRH